MIDHAAMSRLPFEHRVDTWVRDTLARGMSFETLLRCLPGIYPTAVLASLKRLRRENEISDEAFRALEKSATKDQQELIFDRSLPPPHPLNFEWRFTKESALKILGAASRSAPENGKILLFGTPGVARLAIKQALPQSVTCFGEDNAVADLIDLENRRAGEPLLTARCGSILEEGQADSVIIDPPWYDDFIAGMLKSAVFACKLGGTLHFALAPFGTGRHTFEHRAQVFSLAKSLGLSLETVQAGALCYETPFFEANALVAAGLCAPPIWRTADLVTFRKVARNIHSVQTESLNEHRWSERVLGRMRIFVRTSNKRSGSSNVLTPIVRGEILPSVSRHDPRRVHADVWTSGNRIFQSGHPELLLEAASLGLYASQQITSLRGPGETSADRLIIRLNAALSRLADREAIEEVRPRAAERSCRRQSTMMDYANGSQPTQLG